MGWALILLIASTAQAQIENLNELALINRCYAHLTGTRLPFNNTLRTSVQGNTVTAVDACMQILDSAKLQGSGANEGRLVSDTPQGRLVLQRLNDFHRTWFPNDNFGSSIPMGFSFNALTRFLYDEGESALHVSRALLTTGINYSEVATGSVSMEALRTSGAIQNPQPVPFGSVANSSIGMKQSLAQATAYNNGTRVNIQSELVQFGDLLGLRRLSLNPSKANLSVTGAMGGPGDYPQYQMPLRTHQSLGGGILGTKSYLILNLGRPDYLPMDGGLRVPRRWARAAFNNLLCRDLPLIRKSDADPYVQATGLPFRQSNNCMQCHATMDRTAYVARNLSFNSVPIPTDDGHMQLSVWPATDPAEAGPVNSDNRFHARPTNGVLYYRTYDGKLINQNLSNIQDLGNAFAANDDMYVCAAARYFKFFTGIDVNLNDIGDTSRPALTADEIKYRNTVIGLGLELKTTQSLRELIRKILSSETYRRSSLQ